MLSIRVNNNLTKGLAEFCPLFSVKEDLLVFIGPLLIAGFCVLCLVCAEEIIPQVFSQDHMEVWFYGIYALLFLVPHVYATVYKLVLDQKLVPGTYAGETKVFWVLIAISGLSFFLLG